MAKVFFYCILLILGILLALLVDLSEVRHILTLITTICLSYIMVEVGLEFTLDKSNLKSYAKDYLVAFTAATFPWIFCSLYFIFVLNIHWEEALLIGRFAAPTSAGVLFTMLAAAGLATTWLFKKARVLAIFDDLDTIFLMIPLQIMIVGFSWQLLLVIPILLLLLFIAYRFLHHLRIPYNPPALFLYGLAIVIGCEFLWHTLGVEVEVLLPAFVFGCILYNPHDPNRPKIHAHEHAYIEPDTKGGVVFDRTVKAAFMFLVGASLPRVQLGLNTLWVVLGHVVAITCLANVGKFFPSFCYKKEASFKERLALGHAMLPRGEVGAGILLVSLNYGISNQAVNLAELSLLLNLILTGLFVWIAVKLVTKPGEKRLQQ